MLIVAKIEVVHSDDQREKLPIELLCILFAFPNVNILRRGCKVCMESKR